MTAVQTADGRNAASKTQANKKYPIDTIAKVSLFLYMHMCIYRCMCVCGGGLIKNRHRNDLCLAGEAAAASATIFYMNRKYFSSLLGKSFP